MNKYLEKIAMNSTALGSLAGIATAGVSNYKRNRPSAQDNVDDLVSGAVIGGLTGYALKGQLLSKIAMMSPVLKGIARKASGAVTNTASASQAISRLAGAKKLGAAVSGMGKPVTALEKMDISHNPALLKGHLHPETAVKDTVNLHRRAVASGVGSMPMQAHAEQVGLRHGRMYGSKV